MVDFQKSKWRAGNAEADRRAQQLKQQFKTVSQTRIPVKKNRSGFFWGWIIVYLALGAVAIAFYDIEQKRIAADEGKFVYFRTCKEALMAGAAPILRGQPGYDWWLDADNDGIACEPFPN